VTVLLVIVSVVAALVAVTAAVIALRAARSTADAGNPHPAHGLIVEVVAGGVRRDLAADLRAYTFTLSIANQSAAECVITAAGLRVSYRTRANFLGAVELPLSPGDDDRALRLPLRIASGDTLTRLARLDTSNVLPRHCRVDAYALLLADASGHRWSVDASLPQVLANDHDGDGPRTWGWD
jgi:hypothetical protein